MKFQDTSHSDIFISETLKQVVLLVLRVPREYRLEEAQERKSLICISVGRVSRQEWKTQGGLVEVGCCGLTGQSLLRVLVLWKSMGSRDNELQRLFWKPLKRLPGGSGLRGVTCGKLSCLHTRWEPIALAGWPGRGTHNTP